MKRYEATLKLNFDFDAEDKKDANRYLNNLLSKIQGYLPSHVVITGEGPSEIKELEF